MRELTLKVDLDFGAVVFALACYIMVQAFIDYQEHKVFMQSVEVCGD